MGASAEASGGKTDVDIGTIYWDKIQQLMDMDEEYNRIDRGNAFGSWEYDPETKSQNWVAKSPGMQAGQDRMDRRLAGEGFNDPNMASIGDALTRTRMDKMGLAQPPAQQPLPPAQQAVVDAQNPQPPMPPPPPQTGQPPPNGMPQPPPNGGGGRDRRGGGRRQLY